MAYKGKKQLKLNNRKDIKPVGGRNTAPRPFQKAPTGRPLSRNSKAPYNRKAILKARKIAPIFSTKKLIMLAPNKCQQFAKVARLFKRQLNKRAVLTSQRKRRRRSKAVLRFLGKARLK